MSFAPPVPPVEFSSAAFYGRTFAEYLTQFDLDPAALATQRILDVGAGPASFTAEACCAALDVTAVDPLYGQPVASLSTHVQLDYARAARSVPADADLERDRRRAAARFLADYEFGFIHGRYVGAALPRLPFPAGSFDLVLCSHLLFHGPRHSELAWNLAACGELLRVARAVVKIHPLCDLDGRPYPALNELRQALANRGSLSRIEGSGGQALILCPSATAH